VFFFFQAEDGIRDRNVTGVQTCALPISAFVMNRWNAPRRVLPVSRVLLVMIARVLRQFPSPEGHATDRHYPSCRHQGSLPIVELLAGVAPVIAQQCALMVLSPTWLEYVTRPDYGVWLFLGRGLSMLDQSRQHWRCAAWTQYSTSHHGRFVATSLRHVAFPRRSVVAYRELQPDLDAQHD